jgi:hypothetical protein
MRQESISPVNGPEAAFAEQFVKGFLNLLIVKNFLQGLLDWPGGCVRAKRPTDFINLLFIQIGRLLYLRFPLKTLSSSVLEPKFAA